MTNKPQTPRISQSAVVPARGARGHHFAVIPSHHSLDEVVTNTFFGHATHVRAGEKIEIQAQDYSYEGFLVATASPEAGQLPIAVVSIVYPMPASVWRQRYLEAKARAEGLDPPVETKRDLTQPPEGFKVEFRKSTGWRIVEGTRIARHGGKPCTNLASEEDALILAHKIAAA